MLLRPYLRLSAFDSHRWVINTETGHNLLVNQATMQLFQILQHAPALEQARTQFNQDFRAALATPDFAALVQSRFGGYGILSTDTAAPKPPGATYIRLKVELLSAGLAAACARPLRVFYSPKLFWPLFGLLLLFLLAVQLCYAPAPTPTAADYWVVIPLLYASVFVHEFGHIAACGRFGVRHGGIGFGFYLFIFPVLYADVTNIWQIDRQRRIITNLGGIFSQLLYAGLLAATYLYTAYEPLLLAATGTAVVALWQFNPFIRRDGYWLLSDLTNTPNLLAKAAQVTRRGLSWDGLRRVVRTRGQVLVTKRLFLFLYGVANASLFLVFAGYVILRYGHQLLQFPLMVGSLFGKLAAGTLALADLHQMPLIVLVFYVMLLRYFFALLSRPKAQPALA